MTANDADNPHVANLVAPTGTCQLNGMTIDMQLFAQAAQRLGAGKLDTMSIAGYRNARGELVPDYDTVRIERRAEPGEEETHDPHD